MADNEAPVEEKDAKMWEVPKGQELRLEVTEKQAITIILRSGNAEVFGVELRRDQEYVYRRCKIAIYTFFGCQLEVQGKCAVAYIGAETPMINYINCHAALEKMRAEAKRRNTPGPRAMVVGAPSSGRSTLVRMLLNWAVRSGGKPTLVDLDINQNVLTVPGSIAASPISSPMDTHDATIQFKSQLSYFVGFAPPVRGSWGIEGGATSDDGTRQPSKFEQAYNNATAQLAKTIDKRLISKRDGDGLIINTSGWVEEGGFDYLVNTALAFKVDVIMVLGHERLTAELRSEKRLKVDEEGGVRVVNLPKSGGVVTVKTEELTALRQRSIREYFYGCKEDLHPHTVSLRFSDLSIFHFAVDKRLSSALRPLGQESKLDDGGLKRMPRLDKTALLHHVLAISQATAADGMVDRPLFGFVYISAIDNGGVMTCLSPTKDALPSRYALLGNLTWKDD